MASNTLAVPYLNFDIAGLFLQKTSQGRGLSSSVSVTEVVEVGSMLRTSNKTQPACNVALCLKLFELRPTEVLFRKNNVQTPIKVVFSVYEGHLAKGFKQRTPLTSATAERWYLGPEVQRVEVTVGEIKGTLFIPPGSGPFPAVLDLWGGQGGRVEYRSALLASHGYVSLALEYIGLQNAAGKLQHMENTYFETAFTFLQKHPKVRPDRVAVMGMSFGVPVTLGLAAHSEFVEPRCVVCVSGSHIMPVKGSLADVYAALQE
ncbi:acyl-CoA thioesterase 19 [Garra rufa]|uniref:acyl-CoA thioesterase 19 n=1 Tax=Garra rufa TaxID=137080 RepID=UPI003CCE8E4E